MTNMDALSIPAGGGVDTTALIVGDFSNGNDAHHPEGQGQRSPTSRARRSTSSSSRSPTTCSPGRSTRSGSTEKDITVVNTSDADMVAAYGTPRRHRGRHLEPAGLRDRSPCRAPTKVFDSAQIPGEIIDIMVVNTETLKDNPDFGKALVGAWYEVMALMTRARRGGKAAKDGDGQGLRHRPRRLRRAARHDRRCSTTPPRRSPSPRRRSCRRPWTSSRNFLFDHGILGEGATSVGRRRHELPGRQDPRRRRQHQAALRPGFMAMAADGTALTRHAGRAGRERDAERRRGRA